MSQKQAREGGVELLRPVLMLFIIGHHINTHGAGLYTPGSLGFDSWARLANSVFAVAVNAFVFISGYYGMKLRTAALVKILSQCWFYSITIGAAFLLSGAVQWRQDMIWQFVFPVSSDLWWFITCYVILMFFSPLLNAVGNRLEGGHLALIVAALFTIEAGVGYVWEPPNLWGSSGYTPMNFMFIYMTALYLRRFHVIRTRWFYAGIWLCATAAIFAIAVSMVLTGGDVGTWAFSYNSPLLILSAACLFFLFKSLKVDSPLVHQCAPWVLAVYLIHEHPWMRTMLYKEWLEIHTYRSGLKFFAVLPLAMLGIFLSCILIESWRSRLFAGIEKAVLGWAPLRAIDEALVEFQNLPPRPRS
jgi:hypothetical protein